ncbi:MAG: helix-turn-helix domain-containing protein [Bacteroidales bacterium]|nr:helix-turn-helix domain-containing protein [Bacteroidales bacterium]
MEKATRETVKIRREKWKVSDAAKNNLKEFNRIKRTILQELEKEDLTVAQLCDRTGMPKDEVVYYLLSLVKFGFVETGNIDDMDEYYNYKIKRQ